MSSVLGTEAEALATATAYQEAGAAAVEAWLATGPDITADMLNQWVPGTTIPIYTLTEAKDINPPVSPVSLTMTLGGLSYSTQEAPNVPISVAAGEALIAAAQETPMSLDTFGQVGTPDTTLSPELQSWIAGGEIPMTVLPGSSPTEATSMSMVTTDNTYQGQTSQAWWGFLLGGGTLALGVIRWLISKVGWQAIAAVLGTALAAKVAAMLNDGTPDSQDVMIPGTGTAVTGTIVKSWSAGGWPFWMDSTGRIYTKNKSGVVKSWKPKKPIVLTRGKTSLSQFVRASRYLDKMAHTIAKRTKSLKLA